MKLIHPNKISAVGYTTQDANFPASNVMDNYANSQWKATTNTATLTLTVGANSNAVAIFNTNAADVEIQAWDVAETGQVWTSGTIPIYQSQLMDYYELIAGEDEAYYPTSLWYDYSNLGTSLESIGHKLKLIFTTTAPVVQVGIVRAGLAKEFLNPQYGLTEGLKDYSIFKELNNGAEYYRQRHIVKTFSGSLYARRDRAFYNFVSDIAGRMGRLPLAMKITDLPNQDWTIFGRFNSMPSGSHSMFTHSQINFNIEEVV